MSQSPDKKPEKPRSDLIEGLLLFAVFVVFMSLWMIFVDIPYPG